MTDAARDPLLVSGDRGLARSDLAPAHDARPTVQCLVEAKVRAAAPGDLVAVTFIPVRDRDPPAVHQGGIVGQGEIVAHVCQMVSALAGWIRVPAGLSVDRERPHLEVINRSDNGLVLEPELFDQIRSLLASDEGTRSQEQLLTAVAEQIDSVVPLGGPLWEACRYGSECWAGCAPKPPSMAVRLPWIGPHYPARCLAVMAINSRDDGSVSAEIRATIQVIARLAAGYKQFGRGSNFHYRVAACLYAVTRAQVGQPLSDAPTPRQAVDGLLASARLQAVQCAPAGGRRTPTRPMRANCPPWLLARQLEVLEPRLLLLFGGPAHRTLEALGVHVEWLVSWHESGNCFSRGIASLNGSTRTILAMRHPAYNRGWS